jgi:hypothetical protein
VVLIGKSDDDTKLLVERINSSKIKILDSIWDDNLRANGEVLAVETNKAISYISNDTDWCFYIQADEVIHEKYLPVIKSSMLKYLDDDRVDGLLFKYLHFFGNYDYIATSMNWYNNEIRIFKNHRNVYSYKDAQGFRKLINQKLFVKRLMLLYITMDGSETLQKCS